MNNQELDINIDTYPITLNYNSNDLNENKTGFLPVNISVSNPNFVQLYADKYWPNTNPEVPDDQPNNHIFNQPIQFNGKYKFIPFESPPGSFPVAGYIPQYMDNQNATNWDLNINVKFDILNYNIRGENGTIGSGIISQQFTKAVTETTIVVNQYSTLCKIVDNGTYYIINWIPLGTGNENITINNGEIYNIFVGSLGDMFYLIDFNGYITIQDSQMDNTGETLYISKNVFNIPFLNPIQS